MKSRWWPTSWSEWLLAAVIIAFTAWMASYCYWCHGRIVRNGGYVSAIHDFVTGN